MKYLDIKKRVGLLVLSFALLHSAVAGAAQWNGGSQFDQKDFSTQINVIVEGLFEMNKENGKEQLTFLFYPKGNEKTPWNSNPLFWQQLKQAVTGIFGKESKQRKWVKKMEQLHPDKLQKIVDEQNDKKSNNKKKKVRKKNSSKKSPMFDNDDDDDDWQLQYVKQLSLEQFRMHNTDVKDKENEASNNNNNNWQFFDEDKKGKANDNNKYNPYQQVKLGQELWVKSEQELNKIFASATNQNQLKGDADWSCGPTSMCCGISAQGKRKLGKNFIVNCPKSFDFGGSGKRAGPTPPQLTDYCNGFCSNNKICCRSTYIGKNTFDDIEQQIIINVKQGNFVDVLLFWGPQQWHYVLIYSVTTTPDGKIDVVRYWNPANGTKMQNKRDYFSTYMNKKNGAMKQGKNAFWCGLGAGLMTQHDFNVIVIEPVKAAPGNYLPKQSNELQQGIQDVLDLASGISSLFKK